MNKFSSHDVSPSLRKESWDKFLFFQASSHHALWRQQSNSLLRRSDANFSEKGNYSTEKARNTSCGIGLSDGNFSTEKVRNTSCGIGLNHHLSLVCEQCGKSFSGDYRKYNLKKHLKIHETGCEFSCPVCGRPFNQKSSMKRHLYTIHSLDAETLAPLDRLEMQQPPRLPEESESSFNKTL